MSDLVMTVLVLFASLAVRDAIVYECAKRDAINRLTPWQFALGAVAIGAVVIWFVTVPLRRLVTGESSALTVYDKLVSLVVGISVLVCALSLRDLSSGYSSGSDPWIWVSVVVFCVSVLILSVIIIS